MRMNKADLYDFQYKAYTYIMYLTYFLYFAVFVGLFANAPQYLDDLQFYMKIYISVFLMWRFNMFRKVEFTDLDREIAFSSGLFIFTITVVNNFAQKYIKEIRHSLGLRDKPTEYRIGDEMTTNN